VRGEERERGREREREQESEQERERADNKNYGQCQVAQIESDQKTIYVAAIPLSLSFQSENL
jgi:hypothetical protein